MTSEIVKYVNELPVIGNKLAHLEKILASLAKLAKADVQSLMEQLDITNIVECVVTEGETALAILQRLCDAVESSELLHKFESLFIKALTSESETALRMCLSQLHRVAKDCPHCFVSHANIFVTLVELLFAEETGFMEVIEDIILLVGKHKVEMLFCSEVLKILEMVSSEKQLRFYELLIKLAVSSENCLDYILSSGIFSRLFKIYAHAVSDDPLMMLNCLELFASLLTSKTALEHFHANGLIATIARDMVAAKDSSFANILLPAFIKLFTSVGRTNFAMLLSDYSNYFELLDSSCRNPKEIGACLVGLESFAILSQIPECKELLTSNRLPNAKVDEWLQQLRSFLLKGGSDDVQAKAVLICADLFTVPKHIQPTKAYYDINARWFNVLFDSNFDHVIQWAKSPLAERHVASQRLLIALSIQPWAEQLMAATHGFVDFLEDRNTETDKMGRELKYDLVESLFSTKTTANFFDGPDIVKLGVYVRQGPFYAATTATVDMEAE